MGSVLCRTLETRPKAMALMQSPPTRNNAIMTQPPDAEAIAQMGLAIVDHRAPAGEFRLKSLFPKEQWDSFDVVERRSAGKLFKAGMQERANALLNGPNTANHQRYEIADGS